MKTSWITLLVLLIALEQSSCSDEEILPEDERHETSSTGRRTNLKDFEPYRVAYGKLRSTVNHDMDCYEHKENSIPLRYHEDLDSAVMTIKTILPVEYVVVRTSTGNCTNEKMCAKLMRAMRRDSLRIGCRPLDNFYVGGDGYVYEGRGWDAASYWELNGLRPMAITVNFLVDHTKSPPTSRVIEAFRSSLETGVYLGKISKNYKIISMRDLQNNVAHTGLRLQKYLTTWDRWVNITSPSSMWQYVTPKRLTFVFRDQWNASEPIKELVPITGAVENIMLSDGSGEQCLDRSECISRLKAEQMEQILQYGDVIHNFYIGSEGEVYEGRGWNVAPPWKFSGIKNGLLSVRMIGSFETKQPSEAAINSFKLLIQVGEWLGKISPAYRLLSLRQLYSDRTLTGETLYRLAERWAPRWRKEDSLVSVKELGKLELFPMVIQREWDPDLAARNLLHLRFPVDHVIVYYGGHRCFTRRECVTGLNEGKKELSGVLDNFYIGEDGSIYEGRGMKFFTKWRSLFPDTSFITVKFLGQFEEDAPAWPALAALNALLKTGTDTGLLSANYTLTIFPQTHSEGPPLAKGLVGALKETKSWSDKITAGTSVFLRNFTIPLGRWATSSRPHFPKLRTPVKHVVVGSIGGDCATQDECMSKMRFMFNRNTDGLQGILYNFYIGGDGWAYEGRGWEFASSLNLKETNSDFLFVALQRISSHRTPSPIEDYGFRALVEQGVRKGKIAPDYTIVTISQIFPDLEDIAKWGKYRWSEDVPYSSGGDDDDSPSGRSIYVSRGNWSWTPGEIPFRVFHTPGSRNAFKAQRVLVRDVRGHCSTLQECTDFVRSENNKSGISNNRFSMENFYVGGDGRVYEGWGWKVLPIWHWAGKSEDLITVAFIGDFTEDPPNPRATFAFKYLMKFGMYMELISSSYILISPGSHCAADSSPGEALARQIKTWENWSTSSVTRCPNER